jgi:hypothetical protein
LENVDNLSLRSQTAFCGEVIIAKWSFLLHTQSTNNSERFHLPVALCTYTDNPDKVLLKLHPRMRDNHIQSSPIWLMVKSHHHSSI